MSEVTATFRSSVSTFQDGISQTKKSISQNATTFSRNSDAQAASVREFESDSLDTIGALKKRVIKHELLDDIPTGETPRKREYPIPLSWPLTKSREEILGQMNKMPLSNVDINLTSQTPVAISRVRNLTGDEMGLLENSIETRLVTPAFDKSMALDKFMSNGRENVSVFKSRIAAPSRKKTLGPQ